MAERVAGEPVEGQSYDQDQVAGSKKGAITGATSAVPTAAPIERRRTGGRARRRTQVERRLSRVVRRPAECVASRSVLTRTVKANAGSRSNGLLWMAQGPGVEEAARLAP